MTTGMVFASCIRVAPASAVGLYTAAFDGLAGVPVLKEEFKSVRENHALLALRV